MNDSTAENSSAAGAVGLNHSSTDIEGEGMGGVQRQPEEVPDDGAVYVSGQVGPKRCKALNVKEQPCQSTSVGNDGLCAAHSGRAPLGTAEAGRKGAQMSAKAKRERAEARKRQLEEARLGPDEVLRLRAHERRQEIADALIDAAIKRQDVSALRLLYDRVEGRPTDRLEVSQALSVEEREMVEQMRSYSKLSTLSDAELHERLRTEER